MKRLHTTIMISALILAHVLATNSVATPQGILLRYKFHVGQTHRYKMDMDMKMNMTMGDKAMPMKMVMTMLTNV